MNLSQYKLVTSLQFIEVKMSNCFRTGVVQSYSGKDIHLTLPSSITMNDIEYLSLYCFRFTMDFGNVTIPKDINPPLPPYLGNLAVS